MKGRLFIATAIISVALITGVVLWNSGPPDPVYNGKHFSEWADEFASKSNPFEAPEPLNAIRNIGTNAFPYMLKMLATKDSSLKKFAIALSEKQSLIRIHWRHDSSVRYAADTLFLMEGPAARPAVPGLIKLLADRDPDVRQSALEVLSGIGPGASDAVPEISRLLGDKDRRVADRASKTLEMITESDR